MSDIIGDRNRKVFTLRRTEGGTSKAVYLQESGLWTGDEKKIHWMDFQTALCAFYRRVQSCYPKIGVVSEAGLVVVKRQYTMVEDIVAITVI